MALAGGQRSHQPERQDSSDTSLGAIKNSYRSKRQPKRLVEHLTTCNRLPYYRGNLINLARNHSPFLHRMNLMKKLPVHEGCVNTICWNKTGEYILSGSDDRALCITKPTYLFDSSKDYTVKHKVPTRHIGNIFCAQFMPNSNDSLLVSCSSEGPVIVHDINLSDPSQGIYNFNCHSSTIYEVVTLPDDDEVFLSCGEDKTVRLFDLRCHQSCSRSSTCPHPALIRNSHAMTTLFPHPLNSNLLLVGRADGLGLVYDRRKLPNPSNFSREKAHSDYLAGYKEPFKYLHPLEGVVSQMIVPDMEDKCRFTSLCFSSNGSQVLASYSQDYVYLFDCDKSSNFELIQTLPTKSSSASSENANTSDERTGNMTGRGQSRRIPRTPRIRVRGDWSDTGINSVPHSARSESESSQEAPNLLQRMTEVAVRFRNIGSRFIPMTELVAGPLDLAAAAGDNSSDASNEDNRDEEDGERRNEGQGDSSRVDCINERTEEGDNDDEDDDEQDDDDAEVLDESDHSRSNDNSNVSSRKGKSPTGKFAISSETKLKFKKTFAELKDRYNKITTFHPRVRYQGHRNSRTSIKEATFWGDDYIMSGSDCGRIMVWEKDTAKLVMGFPADERVVNCLAPNPHYYALASSGIDYDIKLWSTQSLVEDPLKISQEEMDTIVKNNELMLEEAKQTITVPPHLFFRVLASIAQNSLS